MKDEDRKSGFLMILYFTLACIGFLGALAFLFFAVDAAQKLNALPY